MFPVCEIRRRPVSIVPVPVGKKLGTYPNVEALEAIACRCSQRKDLRTRIGYADLKVTIRVFLLENNTDGLLDVDEESPGCGRLLVVGQAP